MEKKSTEEEDWCFVCKDGGKLILCDNENCPKAYHYDCAGIKKSSANTGMHWECGRHSCFICCKSPTFSCYCCPKAVCSGCLDATYFFPVREKYGFCEKCMNLAQFVEKIMELESTGDEVVDLGTSEEFFKGYYEIIKEQEGLTFDDLQSAKKQWKTEEKYKSCYTLDEVDVEREQLIENNDGIENVKKYDATVKKKRLKLLNKRKLKHKKYAGDDASICREAKICFAAIIPQNLRLVYLTKSLVEEFMKHPETFESKIRGSFVRVKSARYDARQRNSYELVQVRGVKNASGGDDNSDVRLQVLNIPNGVCVNSLSDLYFSEEECEDLRQKVKVGLLEKLTVEELEEKARSLHKDITEHTGHENVSVIQEEILEESVAMNFLNGPCFDFTLLECLERRQRLENKSEVSMLMNKLPNVTPEVPEDESELHNIFDDRNPRTGSANSMVINNELKGDKIARDFEDMNHLESITNSSKHNPVNKRKQSESFHESVPLKSAYTGNEHIPAIQHAKLSEDKSKLNPLFEDKIKDRNQQEGSLVSLPINEWKKSRTTSEIKSTLECILNDIRQNEVLPKSASPQNESKGSKTSSGASNANHSEESPTTVNSLNDADIGSSKKSSSLEELGAQYHSKMLSYEKAWQVYQETSNSLGESNKQIQLLMDEIYVTKQRLYKLEDEIFATKEQANKLENEIYATKERLHKLETELSSCQIENISRESDLKKVSLILNKSKDEVNSAFEAIKECEKE